MVNQVKLGTPSKYSGACAMSEATSNHFNSEGIILMLMTEQTFSNVVQYRMYIRNRFAVNLAGLTMLSKQNSIGATGRPPSTKRLQICIESE